MHPAPGLSEFRLKRRVLFHETDTAGIVHFSNFFRYMEEAEHAMWRAVGLTIYEPATEIGWPRVAASFDFARPLRFEDEFEVVLRIAAMTSKTIRYSCELVRGDTTVATGTMTIACVSRQAGGPMRSMDIPSAVASRFAVFAGAHA